MTRSRRARATRYKLLLLVLILPLASCSRAPARAPAVSGTSAAPSATMLVPPAVSSALERADPAVWAGVLFERAHCAWDWHQTQHAYLAAQQQLTTHGYAAQLAAESDATAWRNGVVAQKQTVICTVSDAHRAGGAPSTSSTVYVRMTVNTEITSTLGTFTGGPRIESWLVRRVTDRWLVAGSFEGG
jgi:hypothetical protein